MSSPDVSKNTDARAALLLEASKLLGAPPQLKSALEALVTGILHRHHLTTCLLLTDDGEGVLRPEFTMGLSSTYAQSIAIPKGEGAIGVTYISALPRHVETLNGHDAQDTLLHGLFQRQKLTSALIVPLKAEGRITGAAFYGSQTLKRFPEESIAELTELSNTMALALYNGKRMRDLEQSKNDLEGQVASTVQELSRTNNRLVQKVRELKTVYELALATAASTKVEDIIRVMTEGIKDLLDVQSAAFFMLNASGDWLEPVGPAFDRPDADVPKLACKPAASSWLSEVIGHREPRILNWIDSAESLPAPWQPIGIRSVIVLPLVGENRVQGLFCAINKSNGLFTQDDARLLSLLTGRVADVLRRLSLDQELRQRVHDLGVLQDISAQLPTSPVLTDTVAAVGRVARLALNADFCFFFLHHAESEALVLMGGDWDNKLSFDLRAFTLGVSEKVPLAEVFRGHEFAHFERSRTTPGWSADEIIGAFSPEELLYLPLTVEQGCLGVMALGTSIGKAIPEDERRLAGLVAKQVAIVIERSRLYERLKSANEKLEQINHLKNEFISMVSHELRTPLTTIKGFVSIVLNEETGPLNDQQRHFLETSDRAIDRLTLLVSDLLDISRIEAGQIKMQLRPIQLRDVAQRLVVSFAPQLKAQNITLTLKIPETLPLVLADPDRITQVLDNLLSNAIKFTTKGGVTISAVDKGDYVMTSVKDTGSGIPKEEHDKIFDKFYQVKVGTGYPSKGTGLGLAIVKSIVESHRGKVWVESDSGKGADFRFILPRARVETPNTSK